jgi:hypothetical protein
MRQKYNFKKYEITLSIKLDIATLKIFHKGFKLSNIACYVCLKQIKQIKGEIRVVKVNL